MIVLVVDIIICVYQIKKSKIKHDDDESWGSKNKFQSYQNKRNLKKF